MQSDSENNITPAALQQQNQELLNMINDLRNQIATVTAQVQTAPQPTMDPAQVTLKQFIDELRNSRPSQDSSSSSTRIPHVEPYDGKDTRRCKEFLLQLHVFLAAQPNNYSTEQKKLAYAISRLRGDAFKWVTPALKDSAQAFISFDDFALKFELSFGARDILNSAEDQLRNIKQRRRPARVLVAEFQTLRLDVDWNDSALISTLYGALDDDLKAEVRREPRPKTFVEYTDLVIRIDNRMHEFRREQQRKNDRQPISNRNALPTPKERNIFRQQPPAPSSIVPMDLDTTRIHPRQLTNEERERRRANNLCGYCGGTHQIDRCDKLAGRERNRRPNMQINSLTSSVPAPSNDRVSFSENISSNSDQQPPPVSPGSSSNPPSGKGRARQ